MGDYVDSVGQRLKEERQRKGWSQRDLARETGVNADTISGIETGQHEPRPSTLRKLAKGLNLEVADFFRDPARPKVLRPRSLDELLERAGLETRWLTLPYKEFETWWRSLDYEVVKRRFWQIHAEYLAFKAESEAIARGESRVAPELERQMGIIAPEAWRRHFQALAAAPGKNESEEEFYKRQNRGELRQFEPVELEAEEIIARAS
jgi:transcriptional regulator with XRE-family HTH domain